MNNVSLMIRLVADPEAPREFGDNCVLELRGVHNRKKKGEDSPVWISVNVWNGWAKNFTGKKGDNCFVNGYLDYDEWEDSDGNKRSKHYLVANTIHVGNPPPRDGDDSETTPSDSLPF